MAGQLVSGLLAVAAFLFVLSSWRSAEARARGLETERDTLLGRLEEREADLQKQKQARARQAEELATLRNRIEKKRKRGSRTPEQPLGTLARIRDHEARAERAEAERDRALALSDTLGRQVAELEARLEAQTRALGAASERSGEGPFAAPDPGASAEGLRAERAEHEEALGKLREELALARQTEARMRKRMSNQEQLYASLRAELEVKKDRLKTQEERLQRLQALKVAIVD
ncbi:MAG TPA: hypothetical protein ENI85_06905 [Deltaproteobacteria bacterium]|nr:hypothetical protein [Deltaproteobacteria bacterium]